MKFLALMFLMVVISSCGKVSQMEASLTGHSVSCVDGVEYVQLRNGASVKYKQDGTVSTC